jgi:hypothetical protein
VPPTLVPETSPDRGGLIAVEGKTMAIAWGNLESHDAAWEQAKEELRVSDVRELSTEQFRAVIARAEQIRKQAA